MAKEKQKVVSGWEAEYDTIRDLLSRKLGLLRFPGQLEQELRDYMQRRAIATIRDSYWMIFLLYFVAALLAVQQFTSQDTVWRSGDLQVALGMFSLTGFSVVLIAICIRFRSLDNWHYRYVAFAGMLAVICLTVAPSLFSDQSMRQRASYFVIFALMIVYGVSNMRMMQSAVIGIGGLAVSCGFLYFAGLTSDMSNLMQYGLLANLVGLGNGYVLEMRDRRLFLQARLLELEKRQLNRLSERMVQLAREDGLTGLANRRHFNDSYLVEWERARREQKPLALVFIDVDHFKAYNDNHGHLEGDRALAAVAAEIKPLARRPGDLAARYGGEEFVLLLPNTPADGALEIAEALLAAVDARRIPHKASSVGAFVSVSMGVASVVPDSHIAPAKLIDIADDALYAAKKAGRHRVVVGSAA